MNFQQCRYVVTIAEAGSFNEAAKRLFVSQPNLSSSIHQLEEELGVQLFIRSNTGARLTDDGYDFIKYAKRIIGELDFLQHRYQEDFKKIFVVASHHYDFLSQPLATISELFSQDYKEFQLIETTTKAVIDSVSSFQSDLGIIYLDESNQSSLERRFKQKDLSFIPLGDFQTRIFLSKNHPLADREALSISDLQGYPQIRFSQDDSGMTFDEDPLAIEDGQKVIYANDRGSLMNMLLATQAYASGLGIVTGFVKEHIKLVPLENSTIHTLGYVISNQKKASDIVEAFVTLIQKELKLVL
ncbi:TPA: LysR family transcriptional regulator [Streptococcus suis]|uniref:LysR family transcriptional regulator n=1 Tax=Streptococcus pluranimalium TaxID=82348 RepID=UPI002931D3BA|nr:LysR family transcriptional regulator [Streptococcus pluranimalium]HEM6115859.1 LysR family transcriptional regulator [Streptococcus suis]